MRGSIGARAAQHLLSGHQPRGDSLSDLCGTGKRIDRGRIVLAQACGRLRSCMRSKVAGASIVRLSGMQQPGVQLHILQAAGGSGVVVVWHGRQSVHLQACEGSSNSN